MALLIFVFFVNFNFVKIFTSQKLIFSSQVQSIDRSWALDNNDGDDDDDIKYSKTYSLHTKSVPRKSVFHDDQT